MYFCITSYFYHCFGGFCRFPFVLSSVFPCHRWCSAAVVRLNTLPFHRAAATCCWTPPPFMVRLFTQSPSQDPLGAKGQKARFCKDHRIPGRECRHPSGCSRLATHAPPPLPLPSPASGGDAVSSAGTPPTAAPEDGDGEGRGGGQGGGGGEGGSCTRKRPAPDVATEATVGASAGDTGGSGSDGVVAAGGVSAAAAAEDGATHVAMDVDVGEGMGAAASSCGTGNGVAAAAEAAGTVGPSNGSVSAAMDVDNGRSENGTVVVGSAAASAARFDDVMAAARLLLGDVERGFEHQQQQRQQLSQTLEQPQQQQEPQQSQPQEQPQQQQEQQQSQTQEQPQQQQRQQPTMCREHAGPGWVDVVRIGGGSEDSTTAVDEKATDAPVRREETKGGRLIVIGGCWRASFRQ